MSRTKFHDNAKRENKGYNGALYPPSPLKINKDSHFIKKPTSSSPPSSSSATTVAAAAVGGVPVKPRHPVIIYTHSPKIIHTHPKDFMALVQKLTGMSRSDDDPPAPQPHMDHRKKPENRSLSDPEEDDKNNINNGNKGVSDDNNNVINDDSESSSVLTTEENIGEQGQANSCGFVALPPLPPPPPLPFFDPPGSHNPYLPTIPILPTNPTDNYLCANQPFFNFDADPLFFAPNMRSSFSSSSSSGFDGLTEFREF